MSNQTTMDLWTLTRERLTLDPDDLAVAITEQVQLPENDYRTRLLVRDATVALREFWGAERFQAWLSGTPARDEILSVTAEDFQEVGFPSLANRIQVSLSPETVRQYLRELGARLTAPVSAIIVGGSTSLILAGLIHRNTEDVFLVDEVPPALRTLHADLTQLKKRYGLILAHFQSHFLPPGWRDRLMSLGSFRNLDVSLVAPLDVAVGKLMSRREKDLDDLRILIHHFDQRQLLNRLLDCKSHLSDERIRKATQHNWYILFGEELPES